MALSRVILNASIFLIAVAFRSEVAVGSSGQAAFVGLSEQEEDASDDDTARSVRVDADAVVVAADENVAELPDIALISQVEHARDASPEASLEQAAPEASAPPSSGLPMGGRHAARYIAVARAASSDDVSPSAAGGAESVAIVDANTDADVSLAAAPIERAASSDISPSMARVAERSAAEATLSASTVGADADDDASPAGVPVARSLASDDMSLADRLAAEWSPIASADADASLGAAPSQAAPSLESERAGLDQVAAEASGDHSQPTSSLFESRVASLAKRTRAALQSGVAVPGGWFKFGVAAFLVVMMILCASPCAAALCPPRVQKSERPRKRPLPKSVMAGRRNLTHQETLSDMLAEVASSGSEDEGARGRTSEKDTLSSSLMAGDLSDLTASLGFSKTSSDAKKTSIEDPDRARLRETKLVLADVAKIARQLQTAALKYPKSGRSGFIFGNSAQKRFLLVLPQPDGDAGKSPRESPRYSRELLMWRAGRLAWWETEASFKDKVKPKGSIPLSKIHDVRVGAEPMSVVIEHQDRESRCTLELVFASGDAAKAWTSRFRDLLVKLNTEID